MTAATLRTARLPAPHRIMSARGRRGARAALLAVLVAALLLPACMTPRPSSSAQAVHGVVFADDPALARQVARELDELLPRVRQLLPAVRDVDAEVWVQQELSVWRWKQVDDWEGFTLRPLDRIHLRRDVPSGRQALLAHELTHLLVDESWDRLPQPVEEGLCDVVAITLQPDIAALMRANRLAAAGAALGDWHFELETRTPSADGTYAVSFMLRGSPVDIEWALGQDELGVYEGQLRGLGFVVAERIVERIGFQGLHDLCLAAAAAGRERVTPAELLAAADLPPSPWAWRAVLAEMVSPRDARIMIPMLIEQQGAAIVRGLAEQYDYDRASDFLRRADPRLRLSGGRDEVRLVRIWGLREVLERHWR